MADINSAVEDMYYPEAKDTRRLIAFMDKIIKNQKELSKEIQEYVCDNFWDLYG